MPKQKDSQSKDMPVSTATQNTANARVVGKVGEKVHGFVSGSSQQPSVQSFSGPGNVLGGAAVTKQAMREERLKRFDKPAVSPQAPVPEKLPRAEGFNSEFKEKLSALMQSKLKQGPQPAAPQQVVPTVTTKSSTRSRTEPVAQAPAKITKEQQTFMGRLKKLFSSSAPSPDQQLKTYRAAQAEKFKAQQKEHKPVSAKNEGLFKQMATWVAGAAGYLNSASAEQSKSFAVTPPNDKPKQAAFVHQSTDLSVATHKEPSEQQQVLTQEQGQLLSLITLFIQIMMTLQAMKQQQVNGQEIQINPAGVLQYAMQLMSASLGQQVQQQNAVAPVNVNIIVGNNNTQVVGQANHSDTSVSAAAGTNVNVITGHGNAQTIQQRNGNASKTDFDFHSNPVAVGASSSKPDQSGPKFTR